MTAATPAIDTAPPAQPRRRRRVAVSILVVLAVISTFVSTVGVWAHRVVFDTDAWVRTVGPLVEDEEVTQAVAAYVVDQIFILIDLDGLAADALPDRAEFLAGPITGAAQAFFTDQVATLLASDQFQEFWVEANRVAHSNAIRLLKGEPGVVTLENGEATLNLLPLVAGALRELDERGILPDSVTVPATTRDTPADEAIAQFEQAFDRDLDDDFAQITVFDSDTLAQAQTALDLFDRAVIAAVLLTVLLAGAAIALSSNRRRTVIQLGVGVVAGFIVAAAAIQMTTNHVLGLISDEVDRTAASRIVDTVLENLRFITRSVGVVAIVAIVVAVVTGDSPTARRTREVGRAVVKREPLPVKVKAAEPFTLLGFVDDHRDGLRVAGLAVALLAVMIVDVTVGSALVIVALLGVFEAAMYLLPKPQITEAPPA